VKKWDWLRAETAKTLENRRSRRCLSQFFHSLGVTVQAVGQVRAEIVLQCIKLGLINHLILDSDCAQRLKEIV
jgi:hypothetical protein